MSAEQNAIDRILKVGIIGAGSNSDYHINFSKAYKGAQIVGIADPDLSRAKECASRHEIQSVFQSTHDLLTQAKPDVVHVVTPPRTHVSVAQEVLEAGCHAIVEKPLALGWDEANTLYQTAERHGVRLCAMHNHLFDPCMRRADMLVKSGQLGQIVNVESYYGLNTNIPPFREYPRPNVLPWLYGLPGGVYQDFLPHPLYVLLEYTGAARALSVMHRSTGVLPQNLPDEIRVLVDGEHSFGTVTFSFAARPHLHFVRIYGTKMMVEVDFNTMTTVVHPVSSLPKAAQKATYNLNDSWQRTLNTASNMFKFVTGRLKPYQGMMTLIHGFYDSLKVGTAPPVSKSQALDVLKAMDQIFEQLHYEPLKHDTIMPPARRASVPSKRILVTGGTGFLGKHLVKRLTADGYTVRVLARKLSRVDALTELGVELFWGDVADMESFDKAFAGCDVVVHLAAGTSGTEKDSQTATLEGTRNLLELCRRHKPQRLIYVSSCSVYGVAELRKGTLVTEQTALERFADRRGSYSATKQEAEGYVSEYMNSGVPTVILRPGTIYGPGTDLFTPILGFSAGHRYVVIGDGSFVLPFVYVENLVDAIVVCERGHEAVGQIFNVVDPEPLTKRRYMDEVICKVDPLAKVSFFPYFALRAIVRVQELLFALLRRPAILTRYRLASSQNSVTYDSSSIRTRLGWTPPVQQKDAFERLVNAELRKQDGLSGDRTTAGDSRAA